jgi:hypothetical protein
MKLHFGVVLVIAIPASAGAMPLTFSQALDRAVGDAPAVAARGLQADAARVAAVAAAALPDPRLQFGFEGFPASGPNAFKPRRDDFSAVRLGISQDVPNAAKRRARALTAEADIGSANAQRRAEIRGVAVAAGLAWIDLHFTDRKLAALDALEGSIAALATTVPARTVSGSLRPAQGIEPEQLRGDLADRRSGLRAAAARASAELTRWTGDPAPTAAGAPPAMPIDAARLRAALDVLPILQVYAAITAQAEAGVKRADADKRPDWGWQASFAARDPRFGNMVGAGITMDLPVFKRDRQDPLAAAKRLEAGRARLDADAARRAAVAALAGDLADHAMHHDRLRTATDILVPAAERRAALDRASYAARRASLGDALDAALALTEARLDRLDREADVARDAVRINLTYGDDLDDR